MKPRDIVVVGGNHHNTLGVVRALGQRGLGDSIKLIVVSETPDFVSVSRYVRRANCRTLHSEEGIVAALDDMCRGEGKAVVICCGDSVSSYIDLHYDLLSPRFVMANARGCQGEITRLMNKEVQMQYAERLGMDLPESLTLSAADIHTLQWDIFPCIVKPLDSLAGNKADIHICASRDELMQSLAASACSRFLIQRYIDRDFEFQLIGCSLDGGARVVIPGFTRLVRQPYNTNTGYLRYSHISQLDFDCTIAERYLSEIGYSGLFSMEFLRGRDGRSYFLEINMRNDGNAYCVTTYGVNLPYLWYNHCVGAESAVPQIDPRHYVSLSMSGT